MLAVLLIANYAHDKQESIARVADLLASGLESIGLKNQVTRPPVPESDARNGIQTKIPPPAGCARVQVIRFGQLWQRQIK